MAIELISKIKPKNNGTFRLVDASDVETTEGTSVQDALNGLGNHTTSTDIHVTTSDKTKWNNGTETANRVEGGLNTHTKNGDIHVTASEKQSWNSFLSSSDSYVKKGDIVNNLTSTDAYKPLSAAQGKALADQIANAGGGDMLKSEYATNGATGKVDLAEQAEYATKAAEADYATSATYLGNYTAASFIKASDIVDNLTSTDTNKPLSAAQGKKLAEQIANAGGGDMLASVYDTDKDGKVNAANTADEASQASNAAKLGNQLPSYYATASVLQDLSEDIVGRQDWETEGNTGRTIASVIGGWTRGDITIGQLCNQWSSSLDTDLRALQHRVKILHDMLACTAQYITFYIDGIPYGATPSMTWAEWCGTNANDRDFQPIGSIIEDENEDTLQNASGVAVKPTDTIINGHKYIT